MDNLKDLFKRRYGPETFKGKAWLRNTDQEDRAAFAMIGNTASDYGRTGGRALVAKRGREYMSAIGKRGAAATKRLREANLAMETYEWQQEANYGD